MQNQASLLEVRAMQDSIPDHLTVQTIYRTKRNEVAWIDEKVTCNLCSWHYTTYHAEENNVEYRCGNPRCPSQLETIIEHLKEGEQLMTTEARPRTEDIELTAITDIKLRHDLSGESLTWITTITFKVAMSPAELSRLLALASQKGHLYAYIGSDQLSLPTPLAQEELPL